jgi:Skp family chaperone for outer membrane proteins
MTEVQTRAGRTRPEVLAELHRRSKRAALVSGVGALVVIGSFAYGIIAMSRIQSRLDDKRTELLKVQTERDQTEQKIVQLKTELQPLEEQLAAKKQELADASAKLQITNKQLQLVRTDRRAVTKAFNVESMTPDQAKELGLAEAIRLCAQPWATAEPTGGKGPGNKPLFNFDLCLRFRGQQSLRDFLHAQIKQVTYHLNHPSFVNQSKSSDQPATDYKVSYIGWGILDNVAVEVQLADDSKITIDFDMSTAIKNAPIKERPPTAD